MIRLFLIHDVQGNGFSSPLNGVDGVVIEGVVVGDFQDVSTQLRGFFLQEEDTDFDADPTTSEGIFVYDNGFMDVSVGDVVRVIGSITEYYDLTEMNNVTNMAICGTGTATAATVNLPIADLDQWEQYEGMLITIPQTLYVTGNYIRGVMVKWTSRSMAAWTYQQRGCPGRMAIALQEMNDRSRIQLEDGRTAQNPDPAPYMGRTTPFAPAIRSRGDGRLALCVLKLTNYIPSTAVNFTRVNMREATPPDVGGALKVASFNVSELLHDDRRQ